MAMEAFSECVICSRCGIKYSKRKGNFPANFSDLYRGTGTLHICNTCLEDIFNKYYAECQDSKTAVRQTCRALNLYWNEQEWILSTKQAAIKNVMRAYVSNIRKAKNLHKTYDDTLREEDMFFAFGKPEVKEPEPEPIEEPEDIFEEEPVYDISEQTKIFWGPGYTDEMYHELDCRYQYWMSEFPENSELDIGTKAIIKQICSLELDINRDRAAGRPIDKSVNALNTLLGSANLKPAQRKTEADAESELMNTPLGVWLWKYENKRPLPEIDPDLKDVNGIKKYVFTWMGHLGKMLGLKNSYTKLYEEEIERLRVERPEYEDEDDESLLIDSYSNESGGDANE